MFFDENLQNFYTVYTIKDAVINYEYPSKDVMYMISTTKFIYIRQEGRSLFNKNIKMNIFYSPSIGYTIYVPASICLDNIQNPGMNSSKSENKIFKSFEFLTRSQNRSKFFIMIEANNLKYQEIGDAMYVNMLNKEADAKQKYLEKLDKEEKTRIENQAEFDKIKNEFANKFNALLKEYNITTFYSYIDEDTALKYKGIKIEETFTDFIEE